MLEVRKKEEKEEKRGRRRREDGVERRTEKCRRVREQAERKSHLVVITQRLLTRVPRHIPAPLPIREESSLGVALGTSTARLADVAVLRVSHVPTPVPENRFVEPVERVLEERSLGVLVRPRRGRTGGRDDAVLVKIVEDARGPQVRKSIVNLGYDSRDAKKKTNKFRHEIVEFGGERLALLTELGELRLLAGDEGEEERAHRPEGESVRKKKEGKKTKSNALVDVHPDLTELERRNTDQRQPQERRHGRPNLVAQRQSHLVRQHNRIDGINAIQRRRSRERNEDLPRREDVPAGDLDARRGEGFFGLFARDELCGDEDWGVEDDTGEGEDSPDGEEGEAVEEEEEGAPARTTDGIDLVVFQAEVPEEGVVVPDALFKLLNTRVVLVDFVADDEALVELDDLTEGEVLTGRAVEAASGLDEL